MQLFLEEKIQLRACKDFDPSQMNEREELELQCILLAKRMLTMKTNPNTVALTVQKGDKMDTIPSADDW